MSPEIAPVKSPALSVTLDLPTPQPHEATRWLPEHVVEHFAKAGTIFFRWEMPRGLTFLSGPPPVALGYSTEELMRDPALIDRIISPSFRENISRFITHLHQAGPRVSAIEIPFLSKAGKTLWYEARVFPQINDAGRVEGFVGMAFEARADVSR